MIYIPFMSYELHVHMAEELKKLFKKKKPIDIFSSDDHMIYPDARNYSEYFRSYVPDANCTEYIDEVFALKRLFHYISADGYIETYKECTDGFDGYIDIAKIYSKISYHPNHSHCQYHFSYHEDDINNKISIISLYEFKAEDRFALGDKEIVIALYGGKSYSIKFAPGAELNRSTYKKLDTSYYYRSLPSQVSIILPNDGSYTYDISSNYDVRQMANTILEETKALKYLVKFYSRAIGVEYTNRLLANLKK